MRLFGGGSGVRSEDETPLTKDALEGCRSAALIRDFFPSR